MYLMVQTIIIFDIFICDFEADFYLKKLFYDH